MAQTTTSTLSPEAQQSSLVAVGLMGAFDGNNDERKRSAAAAAAAARRKRRRALVRRSQNKSSRSRHQTLLTKTAIIQPTIQGVQEVARRWSLGQSIAIPTECTYEVAVRLATTANNKDDDDDDTRSSYNDVTTCWSSRLQQLQQTSCCRREATACAAATSAGAHVYVTSASLSSCDFLRQQLAERKYAVRSCRGNLLVVSFSESMIVLRRLAARVWPGPVILRVAVPTPTLGLTTTFQDTHYLALRCPCHPLALKVYHEYYKKTDNNNNKNTVLVGLPLQQQAQHQHHHQSDSLFSSFVTTANDVATGPVAILHGEARCESFAVPTCEHGHPCPVTLYVEERHRRIRIVTSTSQQEEQQLLERNSSSATIGSNGTASGSNSNGPPTGANSSSHRRPSLTPTSLLQALTASPSSSPSPSKKTSVKDCIVQAVLNKWTVIEENV